MPRIEQVTLDLATDGERQELQKLKERFVAAIGGPIQCEFEKFKDWLQCPVGPGGKLLGECYTRAEKLAPLLSKGRPYSLLNSVLNNPLKKSRSTEEKWAAVADGLNKGGAVVIKGKGTQVAGDTSQFANAETFHAFVLLASIEAEEKKWFIGFDPDITATKETKGRWDKLIEAAFGAADLADLGAKFQKLCETEEGRTKANDVRKGMILGEPGEFFGPLVRKYAIDRTKLLE